MRWLPLISYPSFPGACVLPDWLQAASGEIECLQSMGTEPIFDVRIFPTRFTIGRNPIDLENVTSDRLFIRLRPADPQVINDVGDQGHVVSRMDAYSTDNGFHCGRHNFLPDRSALCGVVDNVLVQSPGKSQLSKIGVRGHFRDRFVNVSCQQRLTCLAFTAGSLGSLTPVFILLVALTNKTEEQSSIAHLSKPLVGARIECLVEQAFVLELVFGDGLKSLECIGRGRFVPNAGEEHDG